MFRGKSNKVAFVAGVIASVMLLQGCSSPEASRESEPTGVNEAVAENKYNPKLSPVFNEPWPTNVTRQEMIETALYKTFAFMDQARVDNCPVNASIFISEKVLEEHIPIVENISTEMNLVFCEYLTEDITIVSGGYDFLKEVVEAENLPKDEFDGICGYELPRSSYTNTGCASQGVAWSGVPLSRRGLSRLNGDAVAIIPHEIFHLVQDSADPGQSGVNQGKGENFFRPVWWVEGGGEYMGRLIPRYFEIQDYAAGPLGESFSNLESFELWGENLAASNDHYYAGQIALEYLTASAGFSAVMETLVLMGGGAEFEVAFGKAFGISVASFYEKFSLMNDNLITN
jgi:hypothetical protein